MLAGHTSGNTLTFGWLHAVIGKKGNKTSSIILREIINIGKI